MARDWPETAAAGGFTATRAVYRDSRGPTIVENKFLLIPPMVRSIWFCIHDIRL